MDSFKEFLLSIDTDSIYSIAGDIIVLVLSLVFLWKIFEKAGEEGWKALIPVYSIYILFKLAWNKKYFWIFLFSLFLMFVGTFITIITLVSSTSSLNIGELICILGAVLYIIIYIKLLLHICDAFNKKRVFMVGLLFLNIIFFGILAFDKSKYVGPSAK